MKFWDTSALLPLLVQEATSVALHDTLASDPVLAVWWGTPVECVSALARVEREGGLPADGFAQALRRLEALRAAWCEVLPSVAVRDTAFRLLRVHSLRAADALQLAAAIVASENRPRTLEFVCLDQRLLQAADREGFVLAPQRS